ncbi:MAG: type II secretion system F family protein [Planctomycetota bacterium]
MIVVVSIIVAVAVMLLATVVARTYFQYAGSRTLDERLDRITGQSTPTLEATGILKDQSIFDDSQSFVERFLPQLPNMNRYFEQAGVKMQPTQFWILTGGLGVAGFLVPLILGMPIFVPILAALTLGAAPFGYVWFMRRKRLNKFGAQLCEALELVARALRAGHSLAAAMHTVSEEMPEPISREFGRVYEEQNLGLSIEQAMRNLAERVPNLDLKFFVTAVIIQRTTGGDLAEILDKIGYIIRERFKILGMVKALTGEGRISGVILIGLPFLLLGIMVNLNYDYTAKLWTDPLGKKMAAGAIFMMTLGALAIRKIVNIKV